MRKRDDLNEYFPNNECLVNLVSARVKGLYQFYHANGLKPLNAETDSVHDMISYIMCTKQTIEHLDILGKDLDVHIAEYINTQEAIEALDTLKGNEKHEVNDACAKLKGAILDFDQVANASELVSHYKKLFTNAEYFKDL
jgi:hypothetical protein